jgi:hypothetical protein
MNDGGCLVTDIDNYYIIWLPVVKSILIKNQLMTAKTDENIERRVKVE